jgi:hypothetical protein
VRIPTNVTGTKGPRLGEQQGTRRITGDTHYPAGVKRANDALAAPAADFQSLPIPFAVADHARFFKPWLRRTAPDTHQDQASGDEAACRPGGFAAPEERWCLTVSNGFMTDPSLPDGSRQSLILLCKQ